MEIKYDEPIPKHTKLRYEECYAYEVLKYINKDKYDRVIIKDKPDLQNKDLNIGIEVTEASSEIHKELESSYIKYTYLDDVLEKEKHRKILNTSGVKTNQFFILWPAQNYYKGIESEPYQVIYKIFNNKLEKLNSGNYQIFSSNEIFIYSELMKKDCWIKDFLIKFQDMSNNYKIKFNLVYLMLGCSIYVFNLVEKSYNIYRLPRDIQYTIAENARNMVINAEKELKCKD